MKAKGVPKYVFVISLSVLALTYVFDVYLMAFGPFGLLFRLFLWIWTFVLLYLTSIRTRIKWITVIALVCFWTANLIWGLSDPVSNRVFLFANRYQMEEVVQILSKDHRIGYAILDHDTLQLGTQMFANDISDPKISNSDLTRLKRILKNRFILDVVVWDDVYLFSTDRFIDNRSGFAFCSDHPPRSSMFYNKYFYKARLSTNWYSFTKV